MMTAKTRSLWARDHTRIGAAAAWVALILLILLLVGLDLRLIAQIGQRRDALKALRAKVAEARLRSAQLPIEEVALARAQERYHDVALRLEGGGSMARILELLHQQAKAHRVELVAVQPRTQERQARPVILGPDVTLREVPLTLNVSGRYRHIGEFLGELASAPYLASVRTLHLAKSEGEGLRLSADLVLAVYLADRAPTP